MVFSKTAEKQLKTIYYSLIDLPTKKSLHNASHSQITQNNNDIPGYASNIRR